jgi:hypothetical protein
MNMLRRNLTLGVTLFLLSYLNVLALAHLSTKKCILNYAALQEPIAEIGELTRGKEYRLDLTKYVPYLNDLISQIPTRLNALEYAMKTHFTDEPNIDDDFLDLGPLIENTLLEGFRVKDIQTTALKARKDCHIISGDHITFKQDGEVQQLITIMGYLGWEKTLVALSMSSDFEFITPTGNVINTLQTDGMTAAQKTQAQESYRPYSVLTLNDNLSVGVPLDEVLPALCVIRRGGRSRMPIRTANAAQNSITTMLREFPRAAKAGQELMRNLKNMPVPPHSYQPSVLSGPTGISQVSSMIPMFLKLLAKAALPSNLQVVNGVDLNYFSQLTQMFPKLLKSIRNFPNGRFYATDRNQQGSFRSQYKRNNTLYGHLEAPNAVVTQIFKLHPLLLYNNTLLKDRYLVSNKASGMAYTSPFMPETTNCRSLRRKVCTLYRPHRANHKCARAILAGNRDVSVDCDLYHLTTTKILTPDCEQAKQMVLAPNAKPLWLNCDANKFRRKFKQGTTTIKALCDIEDHDGTTFYKRPFPHDMTLKYSAPEFAEFLVARHYDSQDEQGQRLPILAPITHESDEEYADNYPGYKTARNNDPFEAWEIVQTSAIIVCIMFSVGFTSCAGHKLFKMRKDISGLRTDQTPHFDPKQRDIELLPRMSRRSMIDLPDAATQAPNTIIMPIIQQPDGRLTNYKRPPIRRYRHYSDSN